MARPCDNLENRLKLALELARNRWSPDLQAPTWKRFKSREAASWLRADGFDGLRRMLAVAEDLRAKGAPDDLVRGTRANAVKLIVFSANAANAEENLHIIGRLLRAFEDAGRPLPDGIDRMLGRNIDTLRPDFPLGSNTAAGLVAQALAGLPVARYVDEAEVLLGLAPPRHMSSIDYSILPHRQAEAARALGYTPERRAAGVGWVECKSLTRTSLNVNAVLNVGQAAAACRLRGSDLGCFYVLAPEVYPANIDALCRALRRAHFDPDPRDPWQPVGMPPAVRALFAPSISDPRLRQLLLEIGDRAPDDPLNHLDVRRRLEGFFFVQDPTTLGVIERPRDFGQDALTLPPDTPPPTAPP